MVAHRSSGAMGRSAGYSPRASDAPMTWAACHQTALPEGGPPIPIADGLRLPLDVERSLRLRRGDDRKGALVGSIERIELHAPFQVGQGLVHHPAQPAPLLHALGADLRIG